LPLVAAAAAAALFVPVGLQAAGPAAEASPVAEDARLRTARLIVEITNPYEQMVELNLVGWEAAARKAMSLDPTAAALEKDHPGLFEAVVHAGRPSARAYLANFVREVIAHREQVLALRLTASELDQVLRFFRSDAGRRAVRGLYANLDLAKLGSEVAVEGAATGNAVLTAEEAARIEQDANLGMMAQANAEDKAAILRFTRSAAGHKFNVVSRETEAKLLEMTNNPDPEWLAGQTDVMRAAAIAFIEGRARR
jgi:hypothetical protein